MNADRIAPVVTPRSAEHSTALPEWGVAQRAAAVVGPAVTVAVLAIAILSSVARYGETIGQVAHTQRVLATTQATLSHAQDAETGQRGYLLTGDRAYLAPYEAGRRAIADDTTRLRTLTVDNAEQQRRLDAVEARLREKLGELAQTVVLRERGDEAGAITVVRTNLGQRLMDEIRVELGAIAAAESALLADRQRRQESDARRTVTVVIVGAMLAVVLALLTNRLLAGAATRHAAQSRRLAAQAAELAKQTEQLAEQAVELEMTNERLQEQAVEMEAQQAELEMQTEELTAANEELTQTNHELSTATERLTNEEIRVRALMETEHDARELAERARREAQQANQAKSQFLSTMSHELRTPLNGIGGYTQLIELGIHGPVTDAQRQALGRITRAQQHLLSLIDDILNLSRIEAGKLEYHVRATSLDDVLADVTPMVEPQLATKHIALDVDLAAPTPTVVWADRDRLRQVLLNLLGNAAKFTPDGGRVRVSLAEGTGEDVALAVADSGYGIPPDKLAMIFEPFVQAHRHMQQGEQHSVQGTGLGLTISRDLMRGMGGDITVESTPGEGSTFLVHLRRAAVDGDATEPANDDGR